MAFCAVRDVRGPAASNGAQRIEVRAGRAQSDEKETDARFKEAIESIDENDAKAANELQLRQLEAAREAQLMKQQEAAKEAQLKHQEAAGRLSENPGLSVEAVGRTGDEFYALIRDKLVYEGDVVDGHKVHKVRAEGIELKKDGQVLIQKIN